MYVTFLVLVLLCIISGKLLWCLLAYVVFVPQGGTEEVDYIH